MARPRKTLAIRMRPESKRPPGHPRKCSGGIWRQHFATQHGIGLDYARKKYAQESGRRVLDLARGHRY